MSRAATPNRTRRRLVQVAFLVLTVVGVFIVRGNAERWCPMGGVETLYAYFTDGNLICSLNISNLYILAALLLGTLLLRRAFCGYVCPLGAVGEWLHTLGRRLHLPALRVRGRTDRALAIAKYAALGVILYFTWRVGELVFRGYDPCYALIGRHGEDITIWAYVISGALVLLSLVILVPFCRWLCPLAAVMHPFSRFGITRVQRNHEDCLNCTACSRACPMEIPVDRVRQVTAARCVSCLSCVDACPTRSGRALRWGLPRNWGRPWSQGVLIGTLLTVIGLAVAASYAWPLPSFVKTRGTPPDRAAVAQFDVRGLTCRGRASLLVYFLERDDDLAIPGYLRIDCWPGPNAAPVRIAYDPAYAGEDDLRRAITAAYYDRVAGRWRPSPFGIVGYDPLTRPLSTP